MSDYINRRAAIDAVNGMPDCPNGYSDTYDKAHIIAVLEDVPSVQTDMSGNMSVTNISLDCISRQAAIDALRNRWLKTKNYEGIGEDIAEECEIYLRTVPSVQPQRWIPVKEALPNDGVEVWVTIKGHDVIRCEDGETLEQAIARISKIRWVTQGYWGEEEHAWNDPLFGCPLMVQPIAWMPINTPDPWRGGQDEND